MAGLGELPDGEDLEQVLSTTICIATCSSSVQGRQVSRQR